jgi:acetyl esterase/lipase
VDSLGFPALDAAGLETWRNYSLGLNIRPNLPPLLIQSGDREQNVIVPTFTRLRDAGMPVEWFEYPNEGHVKKGPANKWWVFQRNLDWFRFWLQGYEDLGPAKAEQYARWRQMRDQAASQRTAGQEAPTSTSSKPR